MTQSPIDDGSSSNIAFKKGLNSIISSSGITDESFLSLEESYLRVPFEQAKRSFRNQQRIMDREFDPITTFITGTVSSLTTNLSTASASSASSSNSKIAKKTPVDLTDPDKRERLILRLQDVKAKLLQEETKEREEMITIRWESTMEMMKDQGDQQDDNKTSEESFSDWKEIKLLRLICEHLLRDGKRNAVNEILLKNPKLKQHLDLDVYEKTEEIIADLLSMNGTSCLQFCTECRPALMQLENEQDGKKSQLEFIVRRQEYIEFIRKGDINGAISYARKTWAPSKKIGENTTIIPKEIQQCLALLVIPLDVQTKQYKYLLDSQERWTDCATLFAEKMRQMVGIPNSCSQLESLMMCGLSTLKTYNCLRHLDVDGKTTSTSPINSCPVCMYPSLSDTLPYAHHETSRLICPHTRKIMDANNPPMVLPNGQVYSEEALSKLIISSKPEIIIKCPKTGETYLIGQIRKCFIS